MNFGVRCKTKAFEVAGDTTFFCSVYRSMLYVRNPRTPGRPSFLGVVCAESKPLKLFLHFWFSGFAFLYQMYM